jgi:hypothetical protein
MVSFLQDENRIRDRQMSENAFILVGFCVIESKITKPIDV